MSLDLVILKATGEPEDKVGLRDEIHYRLMAKAKEHKLVLLLRLEDYYADAEFEVNELKEFLSELIKCKEDTIDDDELQELLENLINLGLKAKSFNKSVLAIAD